MGNDSQLDVLKDYMGEPLDISTAEKCRKKIAEHEEMIVQLKKDISPEREKMITSLEGSINNLKKFAQAYEDDGCSSCEKKAVMNDLTTIDGIKSEIVKQEKFLDSLADTSSDAQHLDMIKNIKKETEETILVLNTSLDSISEKAIGQDEPCEMDKIAIPIDLTTLDGANAEIERLTKILDDLESDTSQAIIDCIENSLKNVMIIQSCLSDQTITSTNYVKNVLRTESCDMDIIRSRFTLDNIRLLHGAMAMMTEASEFIDRLKKHVFYGKELKIDDLKIDDWKDQFYPGDVELFKEFLSSDNIRLLHAGMGMSTEAGEFIDMLKKYFEGEGLDLVNLKEEVGDSMWYAGVAMDVLQTTFNEILTTNIAKLRKRYPDKFTEEAAINRDTKAEREILEK